MANVKKLNYIKMFQDTAQVCMTENVCGKCMEKECFVGYARDAISQGMKKDTDTLTGGFEEIPHGDAKGGYDPEDTYDAIAHCMLQCKSCKENHYEDCLINIVRSCFEVIAFGDFQKYEGSTFMYLTELQKKYPDAANIIAKEFMEPKEKWQD